MSLHGDELELGAAGAFSDEAEPRTPGWTPRRWWAWTLAALTLGAILLLAAGSQLGDATFGTSLRAVGCSASALPGLLLLGIGSLLLALGLTLARLRHHGSVLTLDTASLVLSVPIPASLAAITLPGLLGCGIASDIANIGLVGGALVGQGGIALCLAGIALLGAALAGAVQVSWLAPAGSDTEREEPGIVELAMLEAEALAHDDTATRFRGVGDDA